MSLELERPGTNPYGLRVKTYGFSFSSGIRKTEEVHIGDQEIPLEDFLDTACTVLTNQQADEKVNIGDYEISLEDFLDTTYYVLTNTDLHPNDPRLAFVEAIKQVKLKSDSCREFVEAVKQLQVSPGYNPGRKRLSRV